jgi:transcriptional regulator with XRE-family HTH domain
MSSEFNETDLLIKSYRAKLGETISKVRKQKGFSLEHLAAVMNIKPSTISKIESGKFSISIDYLVRLSIFLDYEFKIIEK